MLNISPLFYNEEPDASCFYNKLNITQEMRERIQRSKEEIRICLKKGIPETLKKFGYTEGLLSPRFFTQGSWAYKTINAPARPTQQADIDDGCYLPLGFVTQTRKPSIAAKLFFHVAEEALQPLVIKNKWELVTDKPTCIRIIAFRDAHIDIPLYAIPDSDFRTLDKAMNSHGYLTLSEAAIRSDRDSWTQLPRDKVLLAHREEDWIESDPRPIKTWFLAEVDVKGEQLRRTVRYLKAFRDWQWPQGGPSSILLMAAATPVFEKREKRDDLALLDVASQLPSILRSGVDNPINMDESLTDRLGSAGIEEAAKAFENLERTLRSSIYTNERVSVCSNMKNLFGSRFPSDFEKIREVSLEATIAATPAKAGPTEIVGRTKAG